MKENSFFEDLMISMEQATAFVKGDTRKVSSHKISVSTIPKFESTNIKRIRGQLQLTQKTLAATIGVSL